MGIYVSDHPLRGYEFTLRQAATHTCAAVLEQEEPIRVKVAGVLSQVSIRPSQKTGNLVARLAIEDFTGQVNCFAFGDTVTKYQSLLEKDKVVIIGGRVKFDERSQATERTPELQIFDVEEMGAPMEVSDDESVEGSVMLRIRSATEAQLKWLRGWIDQHPGYHELVIQFQKAKDSSPMVMLKRVRPSEEFLRRIERSLEDCDVEVITHAGVMVEEVQEPA
jgi:DNA polymerase-3 subunit alpha